MPPVSSHNFAKAPNVSIERSKFDRSHGIKTTFDAGYLIPIYVDECLPGDTFNLRMSSFCRLATPLKPIMDNLYLDSFFFAVPVRLLWDNWEKFNGAQDDPGDSTDFTVPQIFAPAGGVLVGSLSDYFGIPVQRYNATPSLNLVFNSLHHRAYNLIYNTWFRDENLQDSLVVDKDDGPDTYGDYVIVKRGKRHDYFTSALPSPQKGADVTIPFGASTAPINRVSNAAAWTAYFDGTDTKVSTGEDVVTKVTTGELTIASGDISLDPLAGLVTDLSSAVATSVNQLREATQMQVLFERDARGGTRYIEIIKSHFGVTSPDARLQRPEYLGGGSSPINVHPVQQTGEAGTTPQGNLAAFGTASFNGHGFNKSFVEHCVLIGMVNVRADLTYQQGLNRMWSRRTRFDFYQPALAHLGEQSILNGELFTQANASDALTFGYQERFAEYRYKPSQITGAFRSVFATTLDIWHLSQEFASLPTLGATFISEDPPLDRVIAVPAEPHMLFDGFINLTTARPMPVYAVPTLGDRL